MSASATPNARRSCRCIEDDFAELLHAVASGRMDEIEPIAAVGQAFDDRDRRRARLSGNARRRRRDSRDRGGRAGRGRHRLPRRHCRARTARSSRAAAACSRSPRLPTASPTRARASIARSTRSISPTASTAATSAGANWNGRAHDPFVGLFLAELRRRDRRRRHRAHDRLPPQADRLAQVARARRRGGDCRALLADLERPAGRRPALHRCGRAARAQGARLL